MPYHGYTVRMYRTRGWHPGLPALSKLGRTVCTPRPHPKGSRSKRLGTRGGKGAQHSHSCPPPRCVSASSHPTLSAGATPGSLSGAACQDSSGGGRQAVGRWLKIAACPRGCRNSVLPAGREHSKRRFLTPEATPSLVSPLQGARETVLKFQVLPLLSGPGG